MTYPPFSSVLKLVVDLFFSKSVGFGRYIRFWVFGLHGHLDPIAVFFWDLEMTYPPIFKGSKSNGVIKFPYTYDLGITPVRLQAGGCLTTKNPM